MSHRTVFVYAILSLAAPALAAAVLDSPVVVDPAPDLAVSVSNTEFALAELGYSLPPDTIISEAAVALSYSTEAPFEMISVRASSKEGVDSLVRSFKQRLPDLSQEKDPSGGVSLSRGEDGEESGPHDLISVRAGEAGTCQITIVAGRPVAISRLRNLSIPGMDPGDLVRPETAARFMAQAVLPRYPGAAVSRSSVSQLVESGKSTVGLMRLLKTKAPASTVLDWYRSRLKDARESSFQGQGGSQTMLLGTMDGRRVSVGVTGDAAATTIILSESGLALTDEDRKANAQASASEKNAVVALDLSVFGTQESAKKEIGLPVYPGASLYSCSVMLWLEKGNLTRNVIYDTQVTKPVGVVTKWYVPQLMGFSRPKGYSSFPLFLQRQSAGKTLSVSGYEMAPGETVITFQLKAPGDERDKRLFAAAPEIQLPVYPGAKIQHRTLTRDLGDEKRQPVGVSSHYEVPASFDDVVAWYVTRLPGYKDKPVSVSKGGRMKMLDSPPQSLLQRSVSISEWSGKVGVALMDFDVPVR